METDINKLTTDTSKILVTGAAGLLASAFCHWLLENTNHIVVGVDNLSGGYKENLPDESDRFEFYQCDVTKDEFCGIFEKEKPVYCANFACWAAEGASPFFRRYTANSNVMLVANVINNCINHDVKRLVHYSTMAVYGHGEHPAPFSEEYLPMPIDPYAVYKYAAEMDIRIAGEQHNLDWTIIRPHNCFSGETKSKFNKNGYGQVYSDKFRNVLGIFMFQYLQGKPMTIFGDGEQKRAFSYIDDSLPCFYKALVQENCSKQIINLGGIKEYTINEAANTLIEVLKEDGYPFGIPELVHVEKRHEVKDAYPTYQKSIYLLGFEHKTDLKDGLRKMWKWVKEDYKINKRKQLTFDKFEVEKGVYSQWKVKK